jgi:hypothetical protein
LNSAGGIDLACQILRWWHASTASRVTVDVVSASNPASGIVQARPKVMARTNRSINHCRPLHGHY